MSEIVDLITQLGFPIFVCLWFMLRTEKVIQSNTEAMNNNTIAMNQWHEK